MTLQRYILLRAPNLKYLRSNELSVNDEKVFVFEDTWKSLTYLTYPVKEWDYGECWPLCPNLSFLRLEGRNAELRGALIKSDPQRILEIVLTRCYQQQI